MAEHTFEVRVEFLVPGKPVVKLLHLHSLLAALAGDEVPNEFCVSSFFPELFLKEVFEVARVYTLVSTVGILPDLPDYLFSAVFVLSFGLAARLFDEFFKVSLKVVVFKVVVKKVLFVDPAVVVFVLDVLEDRDCILFRDPWTVGFENFKEVAFFDVAFSPDVHQFPDILSIPRTWFGLRLAAFFLFLAFHVIQDVLNDFLVRVSECIHDLSTLVQVRYHRSKDMIRTIL